MLKHVRCMKESEGNMDNSKIYEKILLEECFYEIKTRRYNQSGTAGEKILFVPYKYRNLFGVFLA